MYGLHAGSMVFWRRMALLRESIWIPKGASLHTVSGNGLAPGRSVVSACTLAADACTLAAERSIGSGTNLGSFFPMDVPTVRNVEGSGNKLP